MTTYCGIQDLDSLLNGFVAKYYGSYIDDAEDITLGTQFNADQLLSFQETNEWLSGVNSIKQIPIGTQTDGVTPYHVRMLQGNLMIYTRLKSMHYGEFSEGIPGWINVYLSRARDIFNDIKNQNIVFGDDITQGESGIAIGSYGVHSGAALFHSNWESGIYYGSDFAKTYVIQIDGTTNGSNIGQSTFKWSSDNGVSFPNTGVLTATTWTPIDKGLEVRFEPIGTGAQCVYGDNFYIHCVPMNIPNKSGGIRYTTFTRG